MYIPSFKQLSQCVVLDDASKSIQIPDEVLGRLLGRPRAIEAINLGPKCLVVIRLPDFAHVIDRAIGVDYVDEDWYRRQHADVNNAITSKAFETARAHFCAHGYIEGRIPREFQVDQEWYRSKYPDVDAAIRKKSVPSALAHYQSSGYFEGRSPTPGPVGDNITSWNVLIARVSKEFSQPAKPTNLSTAPPTTTFEKNGRSMRK